MTIVEKAVWFVEQRFGEELTLDDVAAAAGVSRYHMARAFGEATGQTVMRYVRGRRLTEAARALADGAPDILAVALDAGYGSHEAFTRAFRDQFGRTPEEVRARRDAGALALVEPLRLDASLLVDLERPRIETHRAMLVAGLGARYTFDANEGIPMLWQRLGPHVGAIPGRTGAATYGVSCNFGEDCSFDYIAGVETTGAGDLGEAYARVRLAERRYAVFSHRGHVSGLRATHYTIWSRAMPDSGLKLADAPHFERYGPDFDPRMGTGPVEIWAPLEG